MCGLAMLVNLSTVALWSASTGTSNVEPSIAWTRRLFAPRFSSVVWMSSTSSASVLLIVFVLLVDGSVKEELISGAGPSTNVQEIRHG